MPRPKKETQNDRLISALKFIGMAQKNKGSEVECFFRASANQITASNGILTAGHLIEEELEAQPHTMKLIAALSNCGKNLSITQLNENSIVVKSAKYSAQIPCCAVKLDEYSPDPAEIPITNIIKTGFGLINQLAQDVAQTVMTSSVLLQSGSMVSTNGGTALEYWHGINLPTLVIPKSFTSAVCRAKKTLTHLGFSNKSVTVWFEDGSWLKTQLFAEAWQDVLGIFDAPADVVITELPKKFYHAVTAVQDFSEEGKEKGHVYISDKGIGSHADKEIGAFYAMPKLGNICVPIRQLKNIEKCCKQIGFYDNTKLYFFGENLRGVMGGVM